MGKQTGCSNPSVLGPFYLKELQMLKGNASCKRFVNQSIVPLTKSQESWLAHGPKFAVGAPHIPYLEGVTSFEQVYQSLNSQYAEDLRVDINSVVRHFISQSIINKWELNALEQLK